MLPRVVKLAWPNKKALRNKPHVKRALQNAAIDILRTYNILGDKLHIAMTCVNLLLSFILCNISFSDGFHNHGGEERKWVTVFYLAPGYKDVVGAHLYFDDNLVVSLIFS